MESIICQIISVEIYSSSYSSQSCEDPVLQAAVQIKNWRERSEHQEDCAIVCGHAGCGTGDIGGDESDGWRA
jgi:hypothetical protein